MTIGAYNPNDPTQAAFLASIAAGENTSGNPLLGTGGTNLSGDPTDAYGFPQWSGNGGSHAAGTYQFQPGTWDSVASEYNLNFQNPQDQSAGAWYTAEQNYSAANNGASLETALQNGQTSQVASTLAPTWTSLATPTGSASFGSNFLSMLGSLGSGVTGFLGGSAGGANAATATGAIAGQAGSAASGLITDIENWVVRGGVIFIGIAIAVVALFFLLEDKNVLPKVIPV